MRHSEQRSRSDQMARSSRGELRHWKVPLLHKLRIGGSVGHAAEQVKKYVPSPASWIGNGTPVSLIGSAINHSVVDDAKKGLAIAPFAYAGAKTLDAMQNGGTPSVPGADGDSRLPFGLDPGDLLDLGLGAANMYGAAKLGQKSSDYAKKAEDAVTGSYNERAPLRIAGIQGMLNPSAGNAAAMAGVNAVKGPQIPQQPLPLALNDPRLAMVQRTMGRGNPWSQPPIPLR